MAEEAQNAGVADEGGAVGPECPKEQECPKGIPAWMATFSDLVTLLLTFFVLLLSFAKTETAKYEAALGSIRNAFGGNVLKQGEVLQLGKSPDNSPTMLETANPIRPFPIEFLTMEGLLDKHEINRESTEVLEEMKDQVNKYDLHDNSIIYEMPEGVKVKIKDKILFKEGTTEAADLNVRVFERIIKLMRENDWTLFVQGHASLGEKAKNGGDALMLSAMRAQDVTRALIERGVRPEQISTVFHGDTRPDTGYGQGSQPNQKFNRRVEFILRKIDLSTPGHKVDPR